MSRVGFAKILTHTLTFLCFYLATIWSLVTAFTPEFSSRQQKSKGRGAKLFIPFFTHFCIHIFSYISCLLILFVAISLSCSFALCPCFLVNVSNSLLFVNLFVHSFLLLTCFVHGQEAEANASLALWRFFGRRGSGHRTCSFVSPSRFTSNFSNFSNCNSLFYFRNFTLYTLYLPRHNLIHRLFHSISYPFQNTVISFRFEALLISACSCSALAGLCDFADILASQVANHSRVAPLFHLFHPIFWQIFKVGPRSPPFAFTGTVWVRIGTDRCVVSRTLMNEAHKSCFGSTANRW